MIQLTRHQLKAMQAVALTNLIDYAGSQVHLARMIDVPDSTISGWARRGTISKRGARLVSAHKVLGTVFTVRELRPDITEG